MNERMRAFLRLQKLFERIDYHLVLDSVWDTHVVVETLLEVLAVNARSDIKSEVMKELERQHAALTALREVPEVDHDQLDQLLEGHKAFIDRLHGQSPALVQQMANHEFLNVVRQRFAVSSSPCSFDLPAYHQWLQRPAGQRRDVMTAWLRAFGTVQDAIDSVLEVIRRSTPFQEATAPKGFFQMTLDAHRPPQLLRVAIPCDTNNYPEISAGKHRFTVRFIHQDHPDQRAAQFENDHFLLRQTPELPLARCWNSAVPTRPLSRTTSNSAWPAA